MSTRRKIEKLLKDRGITADSIEFERSGPDDWSWWTITLSKASTNHCRIKLSEPEFTGVIEFCDIDDGMLQLSELPSIKEAG